MIEARIEKIQDEGWTYTIYVTINGIGRIFNEVELTPEKLKYHIVKQWELVERCQKLSEPYRKNCQEWVGVEFNLKHPQTETSSSGQIP